MYNKQLSHYLVTLRFWPLCLFFVVFWNSNSFLRKLAGKFLLRILETLPQFFWSLWLSSSLFFFYLITYSYIKYSFFYWHTNMFKMHIYIFLIVLKWLKCRIRKINKNKFAQENRVPMTFCTVLVFLLLLLLTVILKKSTASDSSH